MHAIQLEIPLLPPRVQFRTNYDALPQRRIFRAWELGPLPRPSPTSRSLLSRAQNRCPIPTDGAGYHQRRAPAVRRTKARRKKEKEKKKPKTRNGPPSVSCSVLFCFVRHWLRPLEEVTGIVSVTSLVASSSTGQSFNSVCVNRPRQHQHHKGGGG